MSKIQIRSASEQVAGHLRREIAEGVRCGEMPGVIVLAHELGVNHKTVESAMSLLAREGLLRSQGARRPRVIIPMTQPTARSLRIAILTCEPADARLDYIVEIRHELTEAGHIPVFAKKSMSEIGYDIVRLARLVKSTEADAWVVMGGTREILEWFAACPESVFGLFGRFLGLDIAGTAADKSLAFADAVRELTARGHRRIVMLARPGRKLPLPGFSEQAFLDALAEEGIAIGEYHFPLWEESKEGFLRCLDSLFGMTPPTALLIQEVPLFAAVQQFLAMRRIHVPEDVSLICTDPDPNFIWQEPTIAHFSTESAPWVNHLLRWASNISQGRDYRRQVFSKSEFIVGGTIGSVAG